MNVWRFFQKLFCRCKVCKVPPFKAKYIPENDLISKVQIKEFKRVPDDQFTCSKCEIVPEILEMHSDSGNLSLNCNKHAIIQTSTTEYLDSLKTSNFTYLNTKCFVCNAKPRKKKTQLQFCVKCGKPLCKKCIELTHMEDMPFLIPIAEKNNTCRIHPKEKAELYCQDCEEIICEDENVHSDHRLEDTYNLQKEVNKYRQIIFQKNQKLYSMRDFYNLVLQHGNKEVKKNVAESIQKEKERDKYHVSNEFVALASVFTAAPIVFI